MLNAYPRHFLLFMFRRCLIYCLLLILPGLAFAQGEGFRGGERARAFADRVQHREMRIREALERGDITPEEAGALRERLRDVRRQRMERWRAMRGLPPRPPGGPDGVPVMPVPQPPVNTPRSPDMK